MKTSLITSLFFFLSIYSFAQQEATTKDGRTVILSDDGTWKYKEEKKEDVPKSSVTSNGCEQWIKTEEDKVTGEKMISMKETLVISDDGGKTGLGINWFLINGPVLSIVAAGAGACIDTGSKINILFTDGSRLEIANNRKFNCDGSATVYFLGSFGKKNEMKTLASKKIATMRVWTTKSFVEKDFTEEQSEIFMQTASCLLTMNEDKSSRK